MPHDPLDAVSKLPLAVSGERERMEVSNEEEVVRLFEQMRRPLLRYLRTFRLSPQDGEEVVQEVFLALFRHLQEGKPRNNLHGWVFTVAHRLGWRRRQSQSQYESLRAEEWPDPTPSPEQTMAAEQAMARARAVIEALPEQDRRCLYLRAEGLRYRQVSEILGMSVGGVAHSLSRSLAKIARATEK